MGMSATYIIILVMFMDSVSDRIGQNSRFFFQFYHQDHEFLKLLIFRKTFHEIRRVIVFLKNLQNRISSNSLMIMQEYFKLSKLLMTIYNSETSNIQYVCSLVLQLILFTPENIVNENPSPDGRDTTFIFIKSGVKCENP